jgi:hypothetical protein
VPGGLAGGGRDRGGGAQVRPGGFGSEPFGVVPGGDQEQRGGVRADAVQGDQAGGVPGNQGHDERIEADDLAVQELGAAGQPGTASAD